MLPYNFKINFSKKLLVQITNLTNFIDLLNKIIFLRNKRKLRKMCQQYLL